MAMATRRSAHPARKRHQIGLIVSAEMKALLVERAKATDMTQSQVAEELMKKALHYDQMLSAMNTTMGNIRAGNLEAAFRAEGYTSVHSPYGKIWLPPGYPIGARSGFIPPEEEKS
jgi:hypothetical protein